MNSKLSKWVVLICSIGLLSLTSDIYARGGHGGGHHGGGHRGGHHGGGHHHVHHHTGHHGGHGWHNGHWGHGGGYWRNGVWVTSGVSGVGCTWAPAHYNKRGVWIPGHCL